MAAARLNPASLNAYSDGSGIGLTPFQVRVEPSMSQNAATSLRPPPWKA